MEVIREKILVETEYLGANVSCVITEKGLVLIDCPMLPKDAREWAAKVRDVTGKEIAYLISTDHHFDHAMGNGFITDKVISHATAARGIRYLHYNKEELKQMIRKSYPDIIASIEEEIERLDILTPMITFKDSLTLNMGDATLKVDFVGGHSPGTVLIHLMEDKVIFTGDNVETYFPFLGQGHVKSWLSVLEKMMVMDVEVIIPGHGTVGGKEMIENYISFFKNLETEVLHLKSLAFDAEAMAQKTKLIDYFPFPEDEPAKVMQRREWNREQYAIAARHMLKVSSFVRE
jgi:cyclase